MASSNRRTGWLVLALVFGALGSAEPQAPDRHRLWTTVGSAGTVDEADLQKVLLDHGIVQLGRPVVGPPAAGSAAETAAPVLPQTQSAVIRYNVTPVDGMFPPPVAAPSTIGTQLKLRFLDTGGRARVLARLIEVDLASGSETTLITFDSDSFPASSGYQVRFAGECNRRFDFVRKAYYVEATLSADAIVAGAAAGIQVIKLENAPCLG